MTCLLISDNFPPRTGGSGRWFWEIYRRVSRQDYVIAAGEDPRQEAFDRTHDLRVTRLPLTLPGWGVRSLASARGYWRAIRALKQLAVREQARIVHCGRCLPEGLMGLALKWWLGLPYICYVHGEEMNYAVGSRELRWLMHRVLRGAEFVITNSANTRRIVQQDWGVALQRTHLLHPGMDGERFVPAVRDAGRRARLGWGDRHVLMTAGRLQKRKGHDQLIPALQSIRRTIPDVLYAIVGDGEERQPLEQLVDRSGLRGHVQFLGEIDDDGLVNCYQQCDLFVLPNRQVGQDIEGFGMVLVEAQACGKPVVAGASGGTAETMRIPQTGRIVNCEGPDQLAALICELLSSPDLLADMGAAARPWAVEQFDWGTLSMQARRLFALALGQQELPRERALADNAGRQPQTRSPEKEALRC
jgi:phosphatidylinositol alpha-1,6-mannosyltransferase